MDVSHQTADAVLPSAASLAARLQLLGDTEALTASATMAALAVGLDDAARDRLIAVATDRSRSVVDLAEALCEPDDEEELYRIIAALWLQLRFEWQRHNDVLNYAAVENRAMPGIAAEGWVGSALLERLEGLLLPAHRESLSGYALELLTAVGPGPRVRS